MTATDIRQVDAKTLKEWLHDGSEIALLDVREAGQFGESHLLLAMPLPYSVLELDVQRLVPRLNTRIVLVDETGQDVAPLAFERLRELGYTDLQVLEGGVAAWQKAGFELFAGVNVPSKVFGELAEHHFETPHVSATELNRWQQEGKDLIVLDGRPFHEYQKMSIPQAKCCPNGELALRIDDLAVSPDTTIVINCAGRTRSIIGAQTLINLGVQNPVVALENGTQGWYLEDLNLNHGKDERYAEIDSTQDLSDRLARSQALAQRFSIPTVDAHTLQSWWQDGDRSVYLCDVRTPEENKRQPIAGAQHAPGGQLIQATDQYIATRGARVVVVDDDGVRAPVVASWLYMLGWDVNVLPPQEIEAWTAWYNAHQSDKASAPVLPALSELDMEGLKSLLQENVPVLDIRLSLTYRDGHIAGAHWTTRPILTQTLKDLGSSVDRVVLHANDLRVAQLLAMELQAQGIQCAGVFLGSLGSLQEAGVSTESTPDMPADDACIDYLFFVHDRHDGNKEAARQYLKWETGLIAQLDEQEKAMFRFA
ncbi:rhodanese-like domain-containing protein [Orrella sp. 11846]|uniref:rhodanese-like domain-containing protein n=1 Tax=Orrella sp. 11846 TaxID=3409913 RepID=UPI003B5C1327